MIIQEKVRKINFICAMEKVYFSCLTKKWTENLERIPQGGI
jgi:hypothetical protein